MGPFPRTPGPKDWDPAHIHQQPRSLLPTSLSTTTATTTGLYNTHKTNTIDRLSIYTFKPSLIQLGQLLRIEGVPRSPPPPSLGAFSPTTTSRRPLRRTSESHLHYTTPLPPSRRGRGMSLEETSAAPSSAEYGHSAPSVSEYSYPTTAEMPAPIPSPISSAVAAASPPSRHNMPAYDSRAMTPIERWAMRASDSQFNALAGAIGGFTSGVVTCPLDVIKTKLQAQGAHNTLSNGSHVGQPRLYNGLFGTASVIWKDEGLRGMYRGLGPIILGYLPTWAVWFTVYNKSKTWMSQYHGMWSLEQMP